MATDGRINTDFLGAYNNYTKGMRQGWANRTGVDKDFINQETKWDKVIQTGYAPGFDAERVARVKAAAAEAQAQQGLTNNADNVNNYEPVDICLADAAKLLADNISLIDTASGGAKDGIFNKADLEAIANSNAPELQELKEAAIKFLGNAPYLSQLDSAGGGNPDDKITLNDVNIFSVQHANDESPSTMTAGQAANLFSANFGFLSGLDGDQDDDMHSDQLLKAYQTTNNENLKEAIRFFMNNRAELNAMDTGEDGGDPDGCIDTDDLNAYRSRHPSDTVYHATRPAAPRPATATPATTPAATPAPRPAPAAPEGTVYRRSTTTPATPEEIRAARF